MMVSPQNLSCDEAGTFSLLSKLCTSLAREPGGSARPVLAKKMRVCAYETLLRKGREAAPISDPDASPISDILSCYYIRSQNVRSLSEQRSARNLINWIETVQKKKLCKEGNDFERTLRFLVALKDEAPAEKPPEIFQPFTFGLLDELLPRLPRDEFGSSLPYQYYPPHLFQLPFSISRLHLPTEKQSIYTEYTVESFQSYSRHAYSQCIVEGKELKPFQLPTSLMPSQITSGVSTYTNDSVMTCPRLLVPRDLLIPKTESEPRATQQSTDATLEMEEMFRVAPDKGREMCEEQHSLDIWELASSIDKNLPQDIWDIACKLPLVEERQLIVSSSREMALWREMYRDRLGEMHIVSERQFIRHLMYLTIGIESQSFKLNMEQNTFGMRPGLSLEGISLQSVQGYVAGLLSTGTCYRRLYMFAFDYNQNRNSGGYIYEAARNVVRQFLLDFRLKATEIYSECFSSKCEETNCLPSLLQIMHHMEPLRYEIETVASIYKVIDAEAGYKMACGAGLMSYLYNEISLITHVKTARTMFRSLYSICNVYFKFIERFIFQGELEDRHEEFFIRKDIQYAHSCSKRYWDRGFYIADAGAVPSFLRGLAKHILLCGKSFRLLKLCNPTDPLVLLISSDHPSVQCCLSFQQMSRQQRLLDLYRTRCLFVSGEPVTFDHIMLRKEAERKAFTEMASLKQAETMEKIVAERKRLAQLIIAEKQHNLRVLELAIAETKAAKKRVKQRDNVRTELEQAVEKAQDETDAILRNEEKNKMLEYYTKLNLEVEKRKAHTEWKIKRMQLDSIRMQLLSTEERNLKREKIELEHSRNGDGSCTTSIYSDADSASLVRESTDDILSDALMTEVKDNDAQTEFKSGGKDNITDNAINVVSTKKASRDKTLLDAQGNIIPELILNENLLRLEDDNSEFQKTHLQAVKNKKKVLAHECGQIDIENNITDSTDVIVTETLGTVVKFVDNENNINIVGQQPYLHCNQAFVEGKRNKDKVLGTHSDNITKNKQMSDPESEWRDIYLSDAQLEAKINRLKVLGTDEETHRKTLSTEKVNAFETVARAEARKNRQKVLGSDSENPKVFIRSQSTDHLTNAQKEAMVNRQRILGTDSQNSKKYTTMNKQMSDPEIECKDTCMRDAQLEAKINRFKVLGTDEESHYRETLSTEEVDTFQTIASAEARRNRQKVLGTDSENPEIFICSQSTDHLTNAQKEAVVNRQRILGTDCQNPKTYTRSQSTDHLTEAQKEAKANKQKVLGTDYQLEVKSGIKEPLNLAQEEAAKNKKKILSSEYGIALSSTKVDLERRASLKLDLKKPDEIVTQRSQERIFLGITPSTGGLTPGDLFPQLDLETPTTAEIPLIGPSQGDVKSPDNHSRSIIFNRSENDHISSEGFKFPSVVLEEENVESPDEITIIEDSPSKVLDLHLNRHFNCIKSSIWNLDDSPYNFDNFDPFGVKGATLDSKFHLSNKMDAAMKKSWYSNPADLMLEAQKKPYSDIFSGYSPEVEPECDFENANIATLSACFQRSILLPLSYQLEMVNNSILTYYLVNLDIYEHLRSLKDYFFLMDGEFSRTICQNLFQKLVKTINPEELLNYATLHSILDKALGSSVTNINKFSENLSFTISEPPLSFQHSSPDVLQCLSLAYSVGWPTNIILSTEALTRYARLFQFLLKLRRISWILGQDFETLKLSVKLSPDSRALLRSPQYNTAQLYRHIMASLIRAFDNYIVTTCIHSSWTEFEADMRKARTLDDLHDCHVVYIKKVLFRCLLNKRSAPIMKLLNDVFTVILRFSHVLRTRSWVRNETSRHYTNPCFTQLQELFHLFEKLTRHLHKTITRLLECGYQPHLVELLTMVNLNGYYDPPQKTPNTSLDTTH